MTHIRKTPAAACGTGVLRIVSTFFDPFDYEQILRISRGENPESILLEQQKLLQMQERLQCRDSTGQTAEKPEAADNCLCC